MIPRKLIKHLSIALPFFLCSVAMADCRSLHEAEECLQSYIHIVESQIRDFEKGGGDCRAIEFSYLTGVLHGMQVSQNLIESIPQD